MQWKVDLHALLPVCKMHVKKVRVFCIKVFHKIILFVTSNYHQVTTKIETLIVNLTLQYHDIGHLDALAVCWKFVVQNFKFRGNEIKP